MTGRQPPGSTYDDAASSTLSTALTLGSAHRRERGFGASSGVAPGPVSLLCASSTPIATLTARSCRRAAMGALAVQADENRRRHRIAKNKRAGKDALTRTAC
jgi:hypothetical protein